MSYDIRIGVKAKESGKFVTVKTPEYSDPTYNLRPIFARSMGWIYKQDKEYHGPNVIAKIEQGITNLSERMEDYRAYEPDNKWGTCEDALGCLKNWRKCIYDLSEEIPMIDIWFKW